MTESDYDRGRREEREEVASRLLGHFEITGYLDAPTQGQMYAWERFRMAAETWIRSRAPQPPADFGIDFDGTLAKRSQDAPPAPPPSHYPCPECGLGDLPTLTEDRVRAIADERIKAQFALAEDRVREIARQEVLLSRHPDEVFDRLSALESREAIADTDIDGIWARLDKLERERAEGRYVGGVDFGQDIMRVVEAARAWAAANRGVELDPNLEGARLIRAVDSLDSPPSSAATEKPAPTHEWCDACKDFTNSSAHATHLFADVLPKGPKRSLRDAIVCSSCGAKWEGHGPACAPRPEAEIKPATRLRILGWYDEGGVRVMEEDGFRAGNYYIVYTAEQVREAKRTAERRGMDRLADCVTRAGFIGAHAMAEMLASAAPNAPDKDHPPSPHKSLDSTGVQTTLSDEKDRKK